MAFHNAKCQCFLRMRDNQKIDGSDRKGGTIIRTRLGVRWPSPMGDGEIGLYNERHGRFLRMNGANMDTSSHRNEFDMPSRSVWGWERFRVVVTRLPRCDNRVTQAELNKYVNMPKGGGRLTSTSEKRWEHLPVDWIGPRWRVVWTFDGYMALHNTQSNRFMKVGSDNRMTSSSERTWSWIPNDWNRERFICVDAGDGEIALFHPYTNRFVRMNKDSSMGIRAASRMVTRPARDCTSDFASSTALLK